MKMQPQSEEEVAEMLRGAKAPLAVRGGGTRALEAPAGEVLETAGLAGITLYEPGALTLAARAGTPLAAVEAALAAEGQRLAFEPPDMRALYGRDGASTIGGVVAANASGPRRVQAGAARDALLGVRFVDGAGRVVKNGGRVMKNVTGYDLARLVAGSRGRLGVLTEVCLKVLPAAETAETLAAEGLTPAEAVAAMATALGSPFEVTGAAHLAAGAPRTLLRIEGRAASVGYRRDRLLARLGPGWEAVGPAAAAWQAVRDVAAFAGREGSVWRLHLRPTDAPAVLAAAGAEAAVMDWGGGLLWLLAAPGAAGRIRAAAAAAGGHATLWRAAPGEDAARLPPEAPAVAALTAGLIRAFDPRGILAA
jgi:glycolate oxidase FAD binding subunit